ncbi:energy transducer TonB [Pedobacter africanus]|uniref:TonB family C-terminal domain-containing protein n=1 Tax=Pedobacter africanus TaxID=151894 RepID=A0A1W2CVD4_9SPHI|nr:energy transducer TonB [Pedobacter africanus]SMC89193.1 TonB family C-terminal domain-containing protein [Pedobacter africanus]
MILRLTIFILFICPSAFSYGQKVDTIFLNSDFALADRESSSYFRIVKTIAKGKQYEIADYYKTGEPYMIGLYSSLNPEIREGEFSWFHKNGTKKRLQRYAKNELLSETNFDEKGTEQKMPEIKGGHPLAADKAYDFVSIEKPPVYPGGIANFYKYLRKNLVIPARLRYTSGTVLLSFVIDKDGSVTDVTLIEGVHPQIDKIVLKVISACPNWEPGIQDGKNVRVKYNIPIAIN